MHEGHRMRLKKRFVEQGLDGFDVHNVLELLLFFSIPRRDTNEIAHELITCYGSLSGVLEAPYEELKNFNGLGESSATLIKLIPSLSRRYLSERYSLDSVITSTQSAAEFLMPRFIGLTKEIIILLCLDNKGHIRNCSTISEGIPNMTEINNRKILEIALRHNATSVIISHNHPNGLPAPSKADISVTKSLIEILSSVGIKLLDHIIIANGETYSMADNHVFGVLFH